MFDFLIVGAGLFGATLAELLTKNNYTVLVVERDSQVGGTVSTEFVHNICVHKHGAHIFRTNDAVIWNYISKFDEFIPFINAPLVVHNKTVYNLPFNMNTFSKLWNIRSPDEARKIIDAQTRDYGLSGPPNNLEEFALSTVGKDIYEAFIKNYTEKQWGKPCSELPSNLMRRIPIRFTYNNNYYNARYQGIPKSGYSNIIKKMLAKSTVVCNMDGKKFLNLHPNIARKIIYTGCIDEYFNYVYGKLRYRSLLFETDFLSDIDNFQGNAVVNYSDADVKYTRIIEHKHFLGTDCAGTIITKEYPIAYDEHNNYPYYPVDDNDNRKLYYKYLDLAPDNIIFAGRLGSFRYFDMSDTIKEAFDLSVKLIY